jgi:hypothetical protein
MRTAPTLVASLVADPYSLYRLLDNLNEQGVNPDVSGYDKANVPFLAWLVSDGDLAQPVAATLGGGDAERPELREVGTEELRHPVTVSRPSDDQG